VDEQRALDDLLDLYRWRFGIEDPQVLDWTTTMRVRTRITDPPVRDVRPNAPARNTVVFGPAGDRLPQPDRSVPIVVVDGGPPAPSAPTLAEARRVARDAVVVWAHDGRVEVEWLREADRDSPEVSVLVHSSERDRLDACLLSLAETTPATGAIEIVVADAGETDHAAAVASAWSARLPLRYVRADPALGPVAACNAAADAARGELVVLLGDRTRVSSAWLRPLVRALRDELDVGVAGGKLLAEDGVIDEAGGLVFADGSLAGFGRGAPDGDPLAAFARDVDYVSADLLATRRGLFRRLGGIDGRFHPGFEAADYCLRVRLAGRRVVYRPDAVAARLPYPAVAAGDDARARFAGGGPRRSRRRPSGPRASTPPRGRGSRGGPDQRRRRSRANRLLGRASGVRDRSQAATPSPSGTLPSSSGFGAACEASSSQW
jgi:hypothetical protein